VRKRWSNPFADLAEKADDTLSYMWKTWDKAEIQGTAWQYFMIKLYPPTTHSPNSITLKSQSASWNPWGL